MTIYFWKTKTILSSPCWYLPSAGLFGPNECLRRWSPPRRCLCSCSHPHSRQTPETQRHVTESQSSIKTLKQQYQWITVKLQLNAKFSSQILKLGGPPVVVQSLGDQALVIYSRLLITAVLKHISRPNHCQNNPLITTHRVGDQTYLYSLQYFFIDFFIQSLPHSFLKSHWQVVSSMDGSLKVSKSQQSHIFIWAASSTLKPSAETRLTAGKANVPLLSFQTARYSKTDLSLSRQLKIHFQSLNSHHPSVREESF